MKKASLKALEGRPELPVRLFAARRSVLAAFGSVLATGRFAACRSVLATFGRLATARLLGATWGGFLATIRGAATSTNTTRDEHCQGENCENFLHWFFSYWLFPKLIINSVLFL